MNWKRKTVIRILLLVACLIADEEYRGEIGSLANHIAAWAPEAAA